MKQTVILLRNLRAALGARSPSAPQPRRAVERNHPTASVEPDGPRKRGSGQANPGTGSQGCLRHTPTAYRPCITFVRPSYRLCTGGVPVLYRLSTVKKGLIPVNTGKY